MASIRRTEAEWAAGALGVTDVRWLGFADSGMASGAVTGRLMNPRRSASGPGGFAHQNVAAAAQRLGEVLVEVEATCVVGYDETGIYGHPDHVAVCRVA
ncbi:MAG: PIG-L family deacetylase [Candidatus Microthrix sp.]|nr:PIG-L family deacetylase [Candidatus Microthrix sp.]